MDYQKLRTLIDSDPANASKTDAQVAQWCNSTSPNKKIIEKFGNAQVVASTIGAQRSATVLDNLTAAGGALARFAKWVETETGVNFGDPETRNQLDALVSLNYITQTEANQLKALAERTQTRAEEVGISGVVYEGHVYKARAL